MTKKIREGAIDGAHVCRPVACKTLPPGGVGAPGYPSRVADSELTTAAVGLLGALLGGGLSLAGTFYATRSGERRHERESRRAAIQAVLGDLETLGDRRQALVKNLWENPGGVSTEVLQGFLRARSRVLYGLMSVGSPEVVAEWRESWAHEDQVMQLPASQHEADARMPSLLALDYPLAARLAEMLGVDSRPSSS